LNRARALRAPWVAWSLALFLAQVLEVVPLDLDGLGVAALTVDGLGRALLGGAERPGQFLGGELRLMVAALADAGFLHHALLVHDALLLGVAGLELAVLGERPPAAGRAAALVVFHAREQLLTGALHLLFQGLQILPLLVGAAQFLQTLGRVAQLLARL